MRNIDKIDAEKLNNVLPDGLITEQMEYIDGIKTEVEFLYNYIYQIQNNLAKCMLSQKAFKEIAIRLGNKEGLTVDDIIEKSSIIKSDVLNNRNPKSHGTNASDSSFLSHNIIYLKEDLDFQNFKSP